MDSKYTYEQTERPAETYAIPIAVDLIHRSAPESVAEGRRFLTMLDERDLPVLVIPGNHAPLEVTKSLVEGFDSI